MAENAEGDEGRDEATASFMGLAALRIGVCLALVLENSVGGAIEAATRPHQLLVYPELLGDWLPLSLPITTGLVWLFRLLLVGALLGFWTQFCLGALCVIGVPLLGSAQLLGPTVHNMHLLWFLLLLAVSPAGQVWSVDRYLRQRSRLRSPSRSTHKLSNLGARSASTLLFARLLLACVYFFPGAWKLGANGWSWAAPERLIPLFHGKWYQLDFVPGFRVDQHPLLLQLGGLSIMLLELAFPLLVLSVKGRWLALAFGLTFHVLSAQFLGIRFMPLWLCYGMLIDWPWVLAWLHDRQTSSLGKVSVSSRLVECRRAFRARCRTVAFWLGMVLLGGAVVQGVRGQMQSWPFACYPTFHHRIADTLPDVLLVVRSLQGEVSLPSPEQARRRSQAAWGRTWDVLGYYGTPPTQARLVAYTQEQLRLSKIEPGNALVTLYEVRRPIQPEQWDHAPHVVKQLGSVRLDER